MKIPQAAVLLLLACGKSDGASNPAATRIGVRTATAAIGPWSPACAAFTPPESGEPDVLVYAAKAHPELAGGSLVITYATNGTLAQVATSPSLYYPRFVRVP